jgi:hypothetical protein
MPRKSNEEIRRMLGPTPPVKRGDALPSAAHVVETKLNESDYDPDAWHALDEVVGGWIRHKQD